jgi:tetratricopeptide (TPR) repeat protein
LLTLPEIYVGEQRLFTMLDKIAELFRPEQTVPDLIAALALRDWYLSLSAEQRQKLHQHSTWFGTDGETNPLERNVTETSQTAQEYLKGVGSTAVREKDYEFAEMVLLSALKYKDESATNTHFTYTSLIDLYYKQRDNREDAIEKCVEYCRKDIAIADDFVDEFGDVPRIPSFKRLTIIYQKQERYEDALEICNKALEIGTTDGTKSGFEGRKDRLRKKMRG